MKLLVVLRVLLDCSSEQRSTLMTALISFMDSFLSACPLTSESGLVQGDTLHTCGVSEHLYTDSFYISISRPDLVRDGTSGI